jgi:hypothetical protein
MKLNRRALLMGASALVPAALLAACSLTNSNGTTTVTINTNTALAYVSGAAALAAALLGVPGVSAAIGAALPAVEQAISDINAAIPALSQASNGSVSFTFSTTSVPAFVTALEGDVATLVKDAQTAAASFGANVPAQVQTYHSAIVAVANAISALFRVPAPASVAAAAAAPAVTPMTVQQALALVHITAP